jgi:hypothetical protein
MTTSQPPLDPRESPWKRGDVCTLGFKKSGFVLNHTPEYLEVRWMSSDEGVERIPAEEIDTPGSGSKIQLLPHKLPRNCSSESKLALFAWKGRLPSWKRPMQ